MCCGYEIFVGLPVSFVVGWYWLQASSTVCAFWAVFWFCLRLPGEFCCLFFFCLVFLWLLPSIWYLFTAVNFCRCVLLRCTFLVFFSGRTGLSSFPVVAVLCPRCLICYFLIFVKPKTSALSLSSVLCLVFLSFALATSIPQSQHGRLNLGSFFLRLQADA